MTQYEFTGDDLAEVIHKATTDRRDGPDLAECWNLVGLIRTLRCQQKEILERDIPNLNRQISSLQADIRQLEADKLRLNPSPPSIPGRIVRLIPSVRLLADAIAVFMEAEKVAKRRRIDAQIASIKGEIKILKSKIVRHQQAWNKMNNDIERHFAKRRDLGCPHMDMAFFVC